MNRRIGKRQAERYNAELEKLFDWLKSIGGVVSPWIKGEDAITIDTDGGPLWVCPEIVRPDKRHCISIFSQFKDPDRARAAGFDCNRWTGKANWHFAIYDRNYSGPIDPSAVYDYVRRDIERMLTVAA